MRLHVFSGAVKEIVFTGVAALFLFSLLAVENSEALVKALEHDAIKSEVLLTIINAQFEAEEVSAKELFAATVKFYEVQEALQRAKHDLAIAKNPVKDPLEIRLARTQ